MKVKIPPKIKVSIGDYEIFYQPHLSIDESQCGQVWFRKNLIRIDPCFPANEQFVTLIHEVLHIVDRFYKCHLEEDNVDRIARGISEFLVNNLGIEYDWSDIREIKEE